MEMVRGRSGKSCLLHRLQAGLCVLFSKNDEICIRNDEFYIENDDLWATRRRIYHSIKAGLIWYRIFRLTSSKGKSGRSSTCLMKITVARSMHMSWKWGMRMNVLFKNEEFCVEKRGILHERWWILQVLLETLGQTLNDEEIAGVLFSYTNDGSSIEKWWFFPWKQRFFYWKMMTCAARVKQFDTDNSGEISFDEWAKTRNFALKTRSCVLKDEELCINNE